MVSQRLGPSLVQSSSFGLCICDICQESEMHVSGTNSRGFIQARWNPIFDFAYLKSSNTWIDIGKETIYNVQWQDLSPDHVTEADRNEGKEYSSNAASYASSEVNETEARQSCTYLWRKSYLDQVYTRFKMDVPWDGIRQNMEEPSELQIPKKKGGRPKVYNTKEEKLASRRIPVENKKPIGRPRRFPTPQAKIESRRKTP